MCLAALGFSIGSLGGCTEAPPESTTLSVPRPKGRTIVIGSISNEPGKEIRTYQPFATYLAEQLAGVGVSDAQVLVAPNIPAMAKLLQEKQVDFVFDSPFPVIALCRMTDADILLRRWKKGVSEYHSLIFARADAGIDSLADLHGRAIAFEEPFSTSSYLLPKASLLQAGLQMTEKPSVGAPITGGELGYVFSDDDENTFVWVQRRKVDAGAMNNTAFEELSKGSEDYVILHRTVSVPRQLLICRRSLEPRLVEAACAALLAMDRTDEGRQVLAAFQRTKKFDPVVEGSLDSLEPLSQLIAAEVTGVTVTATAGGRAGNEADH